MRCLVLANALNQNGFEVCFASRPQQGDLIEFVREKGFKVYELVTPEQWKTPRNSADYAAWLQVSWKEDADSLLEQIECVDLLIVDHYALDYEWESVVCDRLSCKVFAIDDLVRKHKADLILDQTLMRSESEYAEVNSGTLIVAGCDYAILNPLFADFRERGLPKESLSTAVKVLVTMGGVDKPNATLLVLEALSKLDKERPEVTVLLNRNAPHYAQVESFSAQNQEWIKHLDFVDNMAELMVQHHIAIGAPGSTSWERACLGIPSVIVPLAENQMDIAINLEIAKAVVKVDLEKLSLSCSQAYLELLNNWQEYHETNLELCDGLGLKRVVQEIKKLLSRSDL
jgi:UDP-2,4-diacetamido-2,4,6-trideoxy-beta-L-altropyranose hydrolase